MNRAVWWCGHWESERGAVEREVREKAKCAFRPGAKLRGVGNKLGFILFTEEKDAVVALWGDSQLRIYKEKLDPRWKEVVQLPECFILQRQCVAFIWKVTSKISRDIISSEKYESSV